MPFIVEQINYECEMPVIPFLDTSSRDDYSLCLFAGCSLPGMGFWLDKRYCNCGTDLKSVQEKQTPVSPSKIERPKAFKYLCPKCALESQTTVCALVGAPYYRINDETVECKKCFEYPSSCSSGYCLYLSILSDRPFEVKVGVTRLTRVKKRAFEAGYAAMAVLLPAERTSLSLPEAQFIEKDIMSGINIRWKQQILTTREAFRRDIGFARKDPTKLQTIAAFLSPPSLLLKAEIESVALLIIAEAKKRCRSFPFSAVERLSALEIVEIPEITNGDIQEDKLRSMDLSKLETLPKRRLLGRPCISIPSPNEIIAVKGPGIVLKNESRYYAFRLSRRSVQGREVFDYDIVKRTGQFEPTIRPLDWFDGERVKVK